MVDAKILFQKKVSGGNSGRGVGIMSKFIEINRENSLDTREIVTKILFPNGRIGLKGRINIVPITNVGFSTMSKSYVRGIQLAIYPYNFGLNDHSTFFRRVMIDKNGKIDLDKLKKKFGEVFKVAEEWAKEEELLNKNKEHKYLMEDELHKKIGDIARNIVYKRDNCFSITVNVTEKQALSIAKYLGNAAK